MSGKKKKEEAEAVEETEVGGVSSEGSGDSTEAGSIPASGPSHSEELPGTEGEESGEISGEDNGGGSEIQGNPEEAEGSESGGESETEEVENGSPEEGGSEDQEDSGTESEIEEEEEVFLPDGFQTCKTAEGVSLRVSQKYMGGWVPLSKQQWLKLFQEVSDHYEA